MADRLENTIPSDNEQGDVEELLKEFNENPYDPERKTPADVMRIFFMKNVPIVPVVSRRKVLIGIITREDITSEMSDIDRFSTVKIDRFVTKIAKKLSFDELLPYVSKEKEFNVINIFGEIQGTWSRLELLAACENVQLGGTDPDEEAQKQKEEQVMEWMIYLILEHIPRALYAMNSEGRTIFYNSYFEDILEKNSTDGEYSIEDVEKALSLPSQNDFFFRDDDKKDIFFHNKKFDFYYEKVPMMSNGKEVGYLIYCTSSNAAPSGFESLIPEDAKLSEKKDAFERLVIVNALQENSLDIKKTAKKLGLGQKILSTKMKKFDINL